jgi:hypothetical protein
MPPKPPAKKTRNPRNKGKKKDVNTSDVGVQTVPEMFGFLRLIGI